MKIFKGCGLDKLGRISEISYLNVENSEKYRAVMRVMYKKFEKMKHQMNREEILEELLLERYVMNQDELAALLSQLLEWKSLTSVLDHRKVRTIDEYKNRSYLYSLSPYAIEIERMTIKLEKLFIESAALSPSLFPRIYGYIKEMGSISSKQGREISEWWRNLQDDFRRLNNNYLDYMNQFYSAKSEVLLKSMEFIAYKDIFLEYLQTFISELKNYQRNIEIELLKYDEAFMDEFLEKVIASELEIPRTGLETEDTEDFEEALRDEIRGRWKSFRGWFISPPGKESDAFILFNATNDVIRKIISNAAILINIRSQGDSRKNIYRNAMKLFMEHEDIDESLILSAKLFGVQTPIHYQINRVRETDSTSSSVYDEEPVEFELKTFTRNFRLKTEKQGFTDDTDLKEREMERIRMKTLEEREEVEKYIKDGVLDLAGISEEVSPFFRKTVLTWIGMANINNLKEGMTSFGTSFRIEKRDTEILLKCSDGDLYMPSYRFIFGEGA